MTTDTYEYTYLKKKYKKENFAKYEYRTFDPYRYELTEDRMPTNNNTVHTKSRQFVCDYGSIWFTYHHFPDNCGIGVYSNIVPHFNKDESLELLNKEFVHYIQHTCNKDMIILSDHIDGAVDTMAKMSGGELVPIGKRVLNDNTDNYIKLYQTVRKSTDMTIEINAEYLTPNKRTRT